MIDTWRAVYIVMLRLKDMRLNKKKMITFVLKNNRCLYNELVSVKAARPESSEERSRVGFIIRKSNGSAVFRNRLRRMLREVFRRSIDSFTESVWVLFELPPGPITAPLKKVRESAVDLMLRV